MNRRLHVVRDNTAAARGKAVVDSGRYTPPRGDYLGTITAWGLDVYEGSPQEWKDALAQEIDT